LILLFSAYFSILTDLSSSINLIINLNKKIIALNNDSEEKIIILISDNKNTEQLNSFIFYSYLNNKTYLLETSQKYILLFK